MASVVSIAGVARVSARRPWLAIGDWLIVVAVSAIAATGLNDALTTDSDFLSRPESVRGREFVQQRAGERRYAGGPIDSTVGETRSPSLTPGHSVRMLDSSDSSPVYLSTGFRSAPLPFCGRP